MEPWIYVTLLAATAQAVRFGLQRHLSASRLSTAGATFARFMYSAPLVVAGVWIYASVTAQALPAIPAEFWAYAAFGGAAQILATMCVVALFAYRNFAVGITFKKTEVLMSVGVGLLILGEGVTVWAIVAILIGLVGTVVLSDPPERSAQPWHRRIFNRAVGLGLMSGVLFGCSGVGYRGASLSLEGGDVFLRATLTLACVTMGQSLAMALYMRLFEAGEIGRVLAAWRTAGLVGITSMIGSTCWFVAFTMQTVAYVNAVGQVEMLMSLAMSVFIFREKVVAREILGGGLVLLSVVVLVLVT
ncbi:EamA family transporter [Pseudooctadecabacter jejudonensis]|uniref:EamA-like transporter family protein n=1 Tax=Pseudooctadecabacter jejudonensis TaxID=1391910 RepID=A0A1Y5RRL3_9RHOB|nr:hypothetical protein [Pseudooctadecabacter jejudonensis]SLN23305.1 EamA-like transporter family protein [Pseudooctadecabacter jejudonensis]